MKVEWASKKDGRDAHSTITIKIVSYLIRDPNLTNRELKAPACALSGIRGSNCISYQLHTGIVKASVVFLKLQHQTLA
ncbi:MAG: hypothetical protein EAZ79_13850 [Oscillatoriales cyanobacterium]|nr:MAG: hypothetical protein EAZ79_13850 [Oscillatoriales cyanobacterium]TAF33840.1 MAG: hypothetical protein EAZ69_15580 [Oscillatoriales cyanobacterium]